MKKLVLVLSLPALCLSATASAHFDLTAPTPNTTSTDGGMGSPPCGIGTASGVITPAQGGHPITIKIDEFIGHDGFYRVALALDSPTELPLDNVVKDSQGTILPPSGKPSGTSASADYETTPVFPVLMDHLFVHTAVNNQMFQGDVTLPNVNCDKCTLQVLEFMQDHPFNFASPPDTGPGGGYFYRHCADLKITADPSMPIFTPSSAGSAGSSSGGGAGMSSGGAGMSSGGVATSGGSAGASSTSAGATSSAGGGTSGDMSSSSDSGGCAYSSGRRSRVVDALSGLLLGAFAFGFRRRKRQRSL
ncbi:MAG TPA: SCE4755 family polysaccharide monooxygenase-like protein [Polyangiaceae bacterium]|jgi:hypothetical protein